MLEVTVSVLSPLVDDAVGNARRVAAVAEILTYVYRANGQPLPGDTEAPLDTPDTQETHPNVPDTQ